MRSYKHILMWFALAVITVSGCSNRQPQQKHVTVAIVSAGANFTPFVNGFMEGMQSAGYEEGKNLTYLYDGPTPKEEVDKRLAFLKKQKIDLLYTMTTPITLKAKRSSPAATPRSSSHRFSHRWTPVWLTPKADAALTLPG